MIFSGTTSVHHARDQKGPRNEATIEKASQQVSNPCIFFLFVSFTFDSFWPGLWFESRWWCGHSAASVCKRRKTVGGESYVNLSPGQSQAQARRKFLAIAGAILFLLSLLSQGLFKIKI